MDRNYPSNINGNYCHYYNIVCTIVYNEPKRKQK